MPRPKPTTLDIAKLFDNVPDTLTIRVVNSLGNGIDLGSDPVLLTNGSNANADVVGLATSKTMDANWHAVLLADVSQIITQPVTPAK